MTTMTETRPAMPEFYLVEDAHHEGASTSLGFWIYLMSDCLIFAVLFATYGVLGGSLAAILVLAGICWALKLGRVERIASPEDAADAADQSLPGFDTVGAVVGADGSGALAVADDGRVAVMKRHGARIAVRVDGRPQAVVADDGQVYALPAQQHLGDRGDDGRATW